MSLLIPHKMLECWEGAVRVVRTIYLQVEETPQAKQSTQFGRGRSWTPKKKVEYIKRLSSSFSEQHNGSILLGQLRLTVVYCFPWTAKQKPFRQLGWSFTDHTVDLDNLLKPLKDSLKGVVLRDDSQIVEVRTRKIRYVVGMLAVRIDEILPNREWLQPVGHKPGKKIENF